MCEPHPIFALIQRHAGVDDSEMFEVFNMGIGFCYVVEGASAERTLAILKAHGRAAQVIGTAVSDPQKIVRIPARGLAGQHKRFWREGREGRGARRGGGVWGVCGFFWPFSGGWPRGKKGPLLCPPPPPP